MIGARSLYSRGGHPTAYATVAVNSKRFATKVSVCVRERERAS